MQMGVRRCRQLVTGAQTSLADDDRKCRGRGAPACAQKRIIGRKSGVLRRSEEELAPAMSQKWKLFRKCKGLVG